MHNICNKYSKDKFKLLNTALIAVLLQMSPLVLPQNAQAQSTQAADRAWVNSDYGYCDAKKVAAVWGVGIGQAKIVIGNKILGNITHLIDADIASTSGRVRCSWDELQMSYNDAVVLGNYWGRQPHEAKTKAENIATDWGKKRLRDFIRNQIGYRISTAEPHNRYIATIRTYQNRFKLHRSMMKVRT